MAASEIILSNGKNIATESITEAGRVRQVQRVAIEEVGAKPTPLREYLKEPGTSESLAVDGSSSVVVFALQPGSAAIYLISEIHLQLVGAAAAPSALGQFADLAGLTNGLLLRHEGDSGTLADLVGGISLKTNEDIAINSEARRNDLSGLVQSFRLILEAPLRVEGNSDNERIELVVQDDLTTLQLARCQVHGWIETSTT